MTRVGRPYVGYRVSRKMYGDETVHIGNPLKKLR